MANTTNENASPSNNPTPMHRVSSESAVIASHQMSWQLLANLRQQQAASLAYFDVFWLAAAVALCLVFLLPFMKRSVAENGAHIAAE